jgi:hypothetical protein
MHPEPPRLSTLKKKRLPCWRNAVTVCIAAICSDGEDNAIVAASDTKVSASYYSKDLASLKTVSLHPKWDALLAGKIAQKSPVVSRLMKSISRDGSYSGDEIAEKCKDAFIDYQKQLAYEKVLSPFGLTLDAFLKSRRQIGAALYERLWNEISGIDIGLDMMVFGFGRSGVPMIFIVSNPTVEKPSFITHCDATNFACIGTGGYLAESSLYGFEQSTSDTIEETIYQVLSAKFLAESATDVGEATYLRVFRADGSEERLDADFISKEVRAHWRQHTKPQIDDPTYKFLETLKEHMKS